MTRLLDALAELPPFLFALVILTGALLPIALAGMAEYAILATILGGMTR